MSNVRALTITGIVVAAAIYIICATFVAAAPDTAATIGGYIFHMDLSGVGRTLTWGGGVIGLVVFTAFIALVCGASGSLYNRLARG